MPWICGLPRVSTLAKIPGTSETVARTPHEIRSSMSNTPGALTEGTPGGVTAEAGEFAFPGYDHEPAQADRRVGL
jgi:hypothetical protein